MSAASTIPFRRADRPRSGAGSRGFVQVPYRALAHPDLSDAAMRAWLALEQWAWRGRFPTNAQLAAACGWRDGQKALRSLRELEARGLIERHTEAGDGYHYRAGIAIKQSPEQYAASLDDSPDPAPRGEAPAPRPPRSNPTRPPVKSDGGPPSNLMGAPPSNLTPSEDVIVKKLETPKTGPGTEADLRNDNENEGRGAEASPIPRAIRAPEAPPAPDPTEAQAPPINPAPPGPPRSEGGLAPGRAPALPEGIKHALGGPGPEPDAPDGPGAEERAEEQRRRFEEFRRRRAQAQAPPASPPPPSPRPEPPAPPPAPAPGPSPRPPGVGLSEAEREKLAGLSEATRARVVEQLASGDPILIGEARKALAPAKAPPPPPAELETEELLARVREDPGHVVAGADRLAREWGDQKSRRGFEARLRDAYEGRIHPDDLAEAYRRVGPKSEEPGAVFNSVLAGLVKLRAKADAEAEARGGAA